ncbi:hypothetical protein ISCGN_024297 [Ixodes scapularis]
MPFCWTLFGNPPTTVDGFVTEVTNIERALPARASHYHRLAGVPVLPTVASCRLDLNTASVDGLREIVRDIVREELREMLPGANRPSSLSLAEVVREEDHRAFQPEVPINTMTPEEPTLSYAAIARQPPQADRQATAPPRRDTLMALHPRRPEGEVHKLGCVASTRTTHVQATVNALGRSTSTCDDLSPPSLRPAESAATPGGGVAEDDRRQDPPRTSEGLHSNTTRDRNDAPATVSNNLNVVIDGHDASALVDTGADYSVLSGRLSRRLRKVTTPWDGPQIRTAGGHLITPVGRCTARVEIHGETCPVKFVILQDCSRDVILGMDFLCEYGAVIDLGRNRLTLRTPVPPSGNPKQRQPRSESLPTT